MQGGGADPTQNVMVFLKLHRFFVKVHGVFVKAHGVFVKVHGDFVKVGGGFAKVGGGSVKVHSFCAAGDCANLRETQTITTNIPRSADGAGRGADCK